jgi:hypothetical protein
MAKKNNRPPTIEINRFQIALLLNEKNMEFYNYVLAENVFCGKCPDKIINGIIVEKIYLDDLNDIRVTGKCRVCNSNVARTIEFGEDKLFYEKAMKFRKSLSSVYQ